LLSPAAARCEFQRDRDRIVHCTAFRRLEYKTQVFVNHEGDLFRTRLTHSIEVAQITRSIARALHLNEDLAEAVALSHDLGHTPFGHAGQEALNTCMKDFGGFEHNLQSLANRRLLEESYAEFNGLNLMHETREGILKHCSPKNAEGSVTSGGVSSKAVSPPSKPSWPIWPTRSPTTTTMWMTACAPGLITLEQLEAVPIFAISGRSSRRPYPGIGRSAADPRNHPADGEHDGGRPDRADPHAISPTPVSAPLMT
jgi:dGTPase